ncbi:lactoylglutathione lyase-like lyase [Hoeflea sp. IMCC20628]|uniref:VOC family protein n=1 Tax=Hoeflea sp. IMCC20628 TaxID=1620421 RepID=UPI00063A8836|nr:VOC family protein [Hoeflea sp. IMCC20628]AKI00101.1 lactoylglutathione lyase-like lyase [Hoeflea sp. IMCC20628]
MKHSILAIAALAMSFGAFSAEAETLPGVRGVNHIGLTVPDIAEAEGFFSDVLGCEKATSFGPFRDDTGSFMQDLLDVDPRAVVNQITLMRCGFGSNIELFSYDAPDQKTVRPRNSDIGGHHIAFYVDDIEAAAAYFKDKGIRTLMGPFPVNEGPAAGQSIIYFFAPWGLQMEAISFPEGMAYEKDGGPVLWSNTDPAK